MKKIEFQRILIFLLFVALSCSAVQKADEEGSPNKLFLKKDPQAKEVFRVFLSSDEYVVSQMRFDNTIMREDDPGGDKFITEELSKFDKINETREGVIKVWLYPDSGRLMKVRPLELTYLVEIDNLIVEDIQRWNFTFPKRVVVPSHFEIRYRVMLQKKQSDREIMREVRDQLREKKVTR
jgi:hypothetical protein